eukprot:6473647-Amphidinium_carterae.1
MHKVRASPARSRKISLAEQASINAPFQGLQIDHKFMFDQHSPYLTVIGTYIRVGSMRILSWTSPVVRWK